MNVDWVGGNHVGAQLREQGKGTAWSHCMAGQVHLSLSVGPEQAGE